MKPYQQTPIVECHEPLVPIPLDQFAVEHPHPYVKLGAPYRDTSPYYLRQGVLNRLLSAQQLLQQQCRGWRIQIVDAYRPIAVQQFMIDYTLAQLLQERNRVAEQLTAVERNALLSEVYQFWAVPSLDPATPPPHSTGAAVDITLVDAEGTVVDMGSPIDELSPRSHPHYFATVQPASAIHRHRELLRGIMLDTGFQQHPNEWWHFSLGDQLWAWLINQNQPSTRRVACYGAIDVLSDATV